VKKNTYGERPSKTSFGDPMKGSSVSFGDPNKTSSVDGYELLEFENSVFTDPYRRRRTTIGGKSKFF
jgi:hypothetical protein